MFNHFRICIPDIALVEGDALLVAQKVVLVLVDLLDLFPTQSLEDLVPLLFLKRELHWLLAGAGKALDLLTLVEPAFFPWADVDRKHGSDFGLEVADGVSSGALHAEIDCAGGALVQHNRNIRLIDIESLYFGGNIKQGGRCGWRRKSA